MRGFILAAMLGPKYFGIYALVCLAYQQFSVFGFGIREGVTLKLSGVDPSKIYFSDILSNIFSFTFIISCTLFTISIPLYLLKDELSEIHEFLYYSYIVFSLSAITINIEILANVQRVLGNLLRVGFTEFFYAASCFIFVLIISGIKGSLSDLFHYMLLLNLVIIIYYIMKIYKLIYFKLSKNLLKDLLSCSLPLLAYNTIMILLQTVGQWLVGFYSNSINLGIYSFGASIALVAGNGMSSISWAYFSEAMSILKKAKNHDEQRIYIQNLHKNLEIVFYITASIVGIFFPMIITIFFEDYEKANLIFAPLMFSLLYQNLIFGDTALLMINNKINYLIKYSSISLILTILTILIYFHIVQEYNLYIKDIELISLIVLLINIIFATYILRYNSFILKYKDMYPIKYMFKTILFVFLFLIFNYLGFIIYFSIISLILTYLFYSSEIHYLINNLLTRNKK